MTAVAKDPAGESSVERSAFSLVVLWILGPMIAQGLWRPLGHWLVLSGSAMSITGLALLVCTTVFIAQRVSLKNPRQSTNALSWSIATGVLVAALSSGSLSLGLAGFLTLLTVAVASAFVVQWLGNAIPSSLDGLASKHRWLTMLYVVAALVTVVNCARVSVFMGDSSRVELQAVPGERFIETHSCLTAYVRASALSAQRVDNLYDPHWWNGSHGFAPRAAGEVDPYRPFNLDYYAYPPPFLFAMLPLRPFDGDFAAQRALWFSLNGLLFAVGLWIVARWIDGPKTHRTLLLSPIFFGAVPILATLQVGNFQVGVVVLSVLAMVAFDRDRSVLGGALLAFVILSKISPAILVMTLLGKRRWKNVAWTAGFGLLFCGLALAVFGLNPMRSFLTFTLPRLSSGAAFSFMDDNDFSIVTNMSPFGLPFKLRMLGLDLGDPWVLGRRIARVYSVLLLLLAFVTAQRGGSRRVQGIGWMSLLVLGSLQSPFAPGYVLIALQWATILLAVEVTRVRGAVTLLLVWVLLSIPPPLHMVVLVRVQGLLQSALALGIPSYLLLRRAPMMQDDPIG